MAKPVELYAHIGEYLKAEVIPPGLTIPAAAELLGVGRPALSNLLNGKATLSKEMAARFERSFNAEANDLLKLQRDFEQPNRQRTDKAVAVRAYVPSFLSIKAGQIESWANTLESRSLLSVLLRHLIRSTVPHVSFIDFPGYDNAERKGNDGIVNANSANAWVPEGQSLWEFGVNNDPAKKADGDYVARVQSVPKSERDKTHFVFVTPRNWAGKTAWAQKKGMLGDWKSVRALDASDLEQWLEESVPAQIWLAEKIGRPASGYRTLDACWKVWADASVPKMTPAIFRPSVEAHKKKLVSWLSEAPERVFLVTADSVEEALAFVKLLLDEPEAEKYADIAAVFDDVSTLRRISAASSSFIPIVATEEAERELAGIFRKLHCIAVRPRNTVISEADISVDLLVPETFIQALGDMGFHGDVAVRYAEESGRSPTILRRRLSPIEAIKRPSWSLNSEYVEWIVPLALIGAWQAQSSGDQEVVSVLTGRNHEEIERNLGRLLAIDDSPVWSVGQYRGVVSKMDALFAIKNLVTEKQLNDFFICAEYVLSEVDPKLELPEKDQWAANIYGKVRNHSGVMRNRICETLVILSLHGNTLFRNRVNFDVHDRVGQLIKSLLTPLEIDKLLSQDRNLPDYAEAAPEQFLRIFEADLSTPEPVVLGLLKPADSGIFGGCLRTGLLWALEGIAWNPKLLTRVVSILGQLSLTRIDDNWANKPIESLKSIFRSWMPQTAASLEQRIKALELLNKRNPQVGWSICIDQFSPHGGIGHYSHKPKWRPDAAGAGEPINNKERFHFIRTTVEVALAWPVHDEGTLGDLVERLSALSSEHRTAVWGLIDAWAAKETDERKRAALRERIRRYAFTRRGRRRKLGEETDERALQAYTLLEPRDLVIRHAWLFSDHWVEESADELDDEKFNYKEREERIHKLRSDAVAEIWNVGGRDGIVRFALSVGAPFVVAHYVASHCKSFSDAEEIVRQILATSDISDRMANLFIMGFLNKLDAALRRKLIEEVANSSNRLTVIRFLRLAPFGPEVWAFIDKLPDDLRAGYWSGVHPSWDRRSESEISELIDRLLEARRPRTAFALAHLDWDKVETGRLKRMLQAIGVAGADEDEADSYKLEAYDVSNALKSLSSRLEVAREELASLEFKFIDALDYDEYGIPNLEIEIGRSPALYVQALAMVFKRSDDGEDPPEWSPRTRTIASSARRVLDKLKLLPGDKGDGHIDEDYLLQWVNEVRELCAKYARVDIGDQYIGQYLCRGPVGEDGAWPCRAVCEVLERNASEHIGIGFGIGVYNSRGVHSRGPGGEQERKLMDKYTSLADRLAFEFPYVSGVLRSIADKYRREADWNDREDRERNRLH